jgi:hypothetical protein
VRTIGVAACLALAVIACAPSTAPTTGAAPSALPSDAGQALARGAGASATAAPQAGPAEQGRVIAGLYREGHERQLLQILGLLAALLVAMTVLSFGVPRRLRRSNLIAPRRQRDTRASRAA